MGQRISEKLLEIATPKLTPLGFRYDNKKSQQSYWVFRREVNGIDQYIEFDQSSRSPNTLRIGFKSSLDMVGIKGHHIVSDHDIWWTYHDSETFEQVVNELVSIALTGGVHWFEVSVRPIPKPNEQVARALFENHWELAKSFENEFGIHFSDPATIYEVEKILKEQSDQSKQVDWDLILKASAYFGEMVKANLGGEWIWREEVLLPVIACIGNKPKLGLSPLSFVTIFWANPYQTLNSKYSSLQYDVTKRV